MESTAERQRPLKRCTATESPRGHAVSPRVGRHLGTSSFGTTTLQVGTARSCHCSGEQGSRQRAHPRSAPRREAQGCVAQGLAQLCPSHTTSKGLPYRAEIESSTRMRNITPRPSSRNSHPPTASPYPHPLCATRSTRSAITIVWTQRITAPDPYMKPLPKKRARGTGFLPPPPGALPHITPRPGVLQHAGKGRAIPVPPGTQQPEATLGVLWGGLAGLGSCERTHAALEEVSLRAC